MENIYLRYTREDHELEIYLRYTGVVEMHQFLPGTVELHQVTHESLMMDHL